MSDEAETLQTLFYAKRRALYPSTVEADVFDTALRALESQNQALQEALREIEAGPYNGFEQCRAIARNALFPTQETDPG